VGVGVADIERAIRWYGEVLGFTLLTGPLEFRAAQFARKGGLTHVLISLFWAQICSTTVHTCTHILV
jgi:catechol 2,3-dioxygenase-like lactoylglutathione lyase family enzyme